MTVSGPSAFLILICVTSSDIFLVSYYRAYLWRLTPYCFARLFWEAWPEEYLTRISSACPLVSLAFTLFSP